MPKIQEDKDTTNGVADTTPKALQPYQDHGLHLTWGAKDKEAIGDCPFCHAEKKFTVDVKTGQYRCFFCAKGTDKGGGNTYVFLRKFHETCMEKTTERDYIALAKDRALLSWQSLKAWGICKSFTQGEWLVPSGNHEGKLNNLYRYVTGPKGKMILKSTWGLNSGMFGFGLFNKKAKRVHIVEGPWDGIALWEVLSGAKANDDGTFSVTTNPKSALIAKESVIGIPGTTSFSETWAPAMAGKFVSLLFDNDHPRTVDGKEIPGGGITGVKRTARILTSTKKPPELVSYVQWGESGYTLDLPNGTDVRDILSGKSSNTSLQSLGERLTAYQTEVLGRLAPVPDDVVGDPTQPETKDGPPPLEPLACTDYRTCVQSWRKAMKWTDGLDHAFAVMLACCTSTRAVGDQLWIKVVSPPSCLDGDTMILDPIDGSNVSVRDRYSAGESFNVYTRKENGSIGIAQALPPNRFDPQSMFDVTFKSGRKIRVTAGHRFWTGESYVALHAISEHQHQCGPFHLPTISESVLSTRMQDALRSLQTTGDSRSHCCACSYPYDEQPQSAADSVRCVVPSQTDAQECDDCKRVDGQERGCKCTPKQCAPLLGDCRDRISAFQTEDGCGCHSLSDNPELSYGRFSSVGNTPRCSSPTRTVQSVGQPCHRSKRDGLEYHYFGEPELCGRLPHGLPPQSQRSFGPPHTSDSKDQSSLGTNRAFSRDVFQLPLPKGNASQPFVLPLESCNTPQVSCRQCKDGPTLDAARQTNSLSEPSDGLHQIWINGIDLGSSTLSQSDEISSVEYVGEREYFDFYVPETLNYWAEGFFHHNSGKTTLCEALSIARQYTYPKDTVTSLTSGYQTDAEGSENLSLAEKLRDKTLIINDGDTLLQLPNLNQVLSQFRAFYGRNLRSQYGNKMSGDHEAINCTVLLCGTNALRKLDTSELGERFLDCVIMDEIDDELEDAILWNVINKSDRGLSIEANGKPEHRQDESMTEAMQRTGGYLIHLRENATDLLSSVDGSDEAKRYVTRLGKFVAFLRARPSSRHDETADRELAARLVSQHWRLAKCLAVVLNKNTIDEEVLQRTRRVALDTARGITLNIVRYLVSRKEGVAFGVLRDGAALTNEGATKMTRFLRRIGVLDYFTPQEQIQNGKVMRFSPRYRLTEKIETLYREVMEERDA